jgi:hypothetical protein
VLRFQLLLLRRVALFAGPLGAEDLQCLGTKTRESPGGIVQSGVRVRRVKRESGELGGKEGHCWRERVHQLLEFLISDKENFT